MLTQTLRELERHGIVARQDYGTVPPRVEYSLTPLGESLAGLVRQIERWVASNYPRLTRAARAYDTSAAP
jgi:DNA-binding HxlR family transcriptional regulator